MLYCTTIYYLYSNIILYNLTYYMVLERIQGWKMPSCTTRAVQVNLANNGLQCDMSRASTNHATKERNSAWRICYNSKGNRNTARPWHCGPKLDSSNSILNPKPQNPEPFMYSILGSAISAHPDAISQGLLRRPPDRTPKLKTGFALELYSGFYEGSRRVPVG